jgi:hypothetical protein
MAHNRFADRRFKLILAGLAAVAFLLLYIDDWSRDFTTNEATLTSTDLDPRLRRMIEARSAEELVAGAKMAARRIGNWSYVGEADYGDRTELQFVRTARLLRFKDDVAIRIVEEDGLRMIVGESRSRVGFADLGVNPRNLRRFFTELHNVLSGATARPVLGFPPAPALNPPTP